MTKRTTATHWEIIKQDETGTLIDLEFTCPHCHYPTGDIIYVEKKDIHKLDAAWEIDQICELCGKDMVVECEDDFH